MAIEKLCETCTFCNTAPESEPCNGCHEYAQWKPLSKVDHPAHYQVGKHECIEEMIWLFGHEAVKNFCMCNVYKYRYRAAEKGGKEDLEKASWYMDKLIELEEGGY